MGTVVGVGMVRDEADVLPATLAQMLSQVDAVLIADNGSTDGTRELLDAVERSGVPVRVVDDPEPAYLQSEKMTRLARLAHDWLDADWLCPFDADEWWMSPFGRIADVLNGLDPSDGVASAVVYDHQPTGVDPDDPDPTVRMVWRRPAALPLPKVAVRWRDDLTIHQGNHGASYGGLRPAVVPGLLVVRHFPYRSAEQTVRKVRNGAAAYAAAGDRLPESMGAHWRQWGRLLDTGGEQAIGDLFRRWYWRADPTVPVEVEGETLPPLVYDPVAAL